MTHAIVETVQEAVGENEHKGMRAWTALRLLLGWSILWAFLDKFFGLGFATCRAAESSSIDFGCDAAMIQGGIPGLRVSEPRHDGQPNGRPVRLDGALGPDSINLADVLFMAVLLLGGVALMLGVGVRTAAIGGAVLMAFMFLAGDVWPENNPINSSHVIEMVAFLGIAHVGAGRFSVQRWVDERVPSLSRIP